MDVKEGHPGAIFDWFFDTNQSTDHRAQMLFMLYGSDSRLLTLADGCLKKLETFNDALGIEILFIFFDPTVSPRQLGEDGRNMKARFDESGPQKYLYSGYGEARAVPLGMIEIGAGKFRSQDPKDYYSDKLRMAAARAHSRAVPFFQEVFSLEPQASGLIFCHRTLRKLSIYNFNNEFLPTPDMLLDAFKPIRKIARHSTGQRDIDLIDDIINDRLGRHVFKKIALQIWDDMKNIHKNLFDVTSIY